MCNRNRETSAINNVVDYGNLETEFEDYWRARKFGQRLQLKEAQA